MKQDAKKPIGFWKYTFTRLWFWVLVAFSFWATAETTSSILGPVIYPLDITFLIGGIFSIIFGVFLVPLIVALIVYSDRKTKGKLLSV